MNPLQDSRYVIPYLHDLTTFVLNNFGLCFKAVELLYERSGQNAAKIILVCWAPQNINGVYAVDNLLLSQELTKHLREPLGRYDKDQCDTAKEMLKLADFWLPVQLKLGIVQPEPSLAKLLDEVG